MADGLYFKLKKKEKKNHNPLVFTSGKFLNYP